MNSQDAARWMEHHRTLFPTWGEWLEGPGKVDRILAIERAMARVDLADAKAASDRMLAGEIKRAWHQEDAVGLIVAACPKQQRPRAIDQIPHAGPFRAMPSQMTAAERENLRQFVADARAAARALRAKKLADAAGGCR